MIDVARTVPRLAEVKQLHLRCVLIDSESFGGRIRERRPHAAIRVEASSAAMLSFSA